MLELIQKILAPFIFVYSFIVSLRNLFFDKGIFKQKKVDSIVISIGNLTVGGSGKTPLVIYVANLLKEKFNVGVISRGYGRATSGYLQVSSKENILVDVQDSGDEMFLIADECKVSTAVSEKRVEGAKRLLLNESLDVLVLDDAFQHRWIARDLDILIFDQRFLHKVRSQEQKLLPLGIMREPFSAIKRAEIIIINSKFSEKKEIPEQLKKYFENKHVFFAHYKNDGIYDLKTHKHYSLNDFKGQKSLVVCGIARPFSFLNVLEKSGINIDNKMIFPDHKDYDEKEIQQIRKKFYDTNSFDVLTTQKDAVKLTHFAKELDDIDIFYLKIDLEIEKSEEFNQLILSKLENNN